MSMITIPGYYEQEPENNTFQDVIIDVTHRCNMSCKNCYIPNREVPDMDMEKMLEAISKFPKRTMIRIIGAEPTMRKDLAEMITRIKQTGNRCTLLTNGLRLANDKYVKKLKQHGLRHCYLSMNGADNDDWYEAIDELRCATKKVQALTNLKHNKFVPGVKIPIKSKKIVKNNNNTMVVLAWNFYNDIKKNNSNLSKNFINIKELEN